MKKTLLSCIAILAMGYAGTLENKAATMQQMRFHCEKDTTELNALLEKGLKSGKKSAN